MIDRAGLFSWSSEERLGSPTSQDKIRKIPANNEDFFMNTSVLIQYRSQDNAMLLLGEFDTLPSIIYCFLFKE